MKIPKILISLCLIAGSVLPSAFTSASASRVRTVPSPSAEKKAETSKTNAITPAKGSTAIPSKNCNEKILSSLYIGNGGLPK